MSRALARRQQIRAISRSRSPTCSRHWPRVRRISRWFRSSSTASKRALIKGEDLSGWATH